MDAEGVTGGFSRAVHIIQSTYAWCTDEVLWKLPLCRFRQMVELVVQDKRDALKMQTQLVEWQTKNVAIMFSTNAESKKQVKAIQKMVETMKLPLADEQSDVIDERTPEDIVENGAQIDMTNQPSFEALEAAFREM